MVMDATGRVFGVGIVVFLIEDALCGGVFECEGADPTDCEVCGTWSASLHRKILKSLIKAPWVME
jgi:hypothetical protein